MKKLLLTLVLGAIGYTSFAQGVLDNTSPNVDSKIKVSPVVVQEGKMETHEKSHGKKADLINAWYNYDDALSSWFLDITRFAPYLAPDTFYQSPLWDNGVVTGYDTVGWNSFGIGFDPTDPLYDSDSDPLTQTFKGYSYTIDSVAIPYFYYRPNHNVVDTLVIQLYASNGSKGSGAETWYQANQGDTIRIATVEFDINTGLGKKAVRTIKVPLGDADTAENSLQSIMVEVDPPIIVDNTSSRVAATMTYFPTAMEPWDTFAGPFNDTLPFHNAFRPLITQDPNNENINSYNNGMIIQWQTRHLPTWFHNSNESSRYISGTAFNANLYPNIYFHVKVSADPPATPTDLKAQVNANGTVTLTWDDVAIDEEGYRIYVSDNSTTWGAPVATRPANTEAYILQSLDVNKTYYAKVGAYKGAGEAFSNDVNFIIVGLDETAGDINSLIFYPNPASQSLTLQLGMEKANNLNVVISDIAGKSISAQSFNVGAGQQNVELDLSAIKAGVYFATLSTDSGTKTVKFVVSK